MSAVPPLVPPEADLRDFRFMPIEIRRLLTSETWIMGSGDERADAITLWLESWHQVPAGSLPSNDRMLAHLAQSKRWPKTKAHALRGWVLCDDGRLYHPVVCEKVLEAWLEKLAASLSGAAGNAKRWGLAIDQAPIRAQFVQAVDMLRTLAPRSPALKKKVVLAIVAGSAPASPPDDPPLSGGESGGLSPPDRKGQGQGQGIEDKDKGAQSADPPPLRAPDGDEGGPLVDAGGVEIEPDDDALRVGMLGGPPGTNGHGPTPAGSVCGAMRRAGMAAVNPGDPRLLALLEQGATEAEFVGIAAEAAKKRKGFAWVLSVVQARRAEAAEIALAPKPEDPNAWRRSELGVRTMAERLGVSMRDGDTFDEFERRVAQAWRRLPPNSQGSTA